MGALTAAEVLAGCWPCFKGCAVETLGGAESLSLGRTPLA
jgi:hypothetical protein